MSSASENTPQAPIAIARSFQRLPDASRAALATRLSAYASGRRWYRSKAAIVSRSTLDAFVPLPVGSSCALSLLGVEHTDHERETYLVPLRLETAAASAVDSAFAPIAEIRLLDPEHADSGAALHDATSSAAFAHALLGLFREGIELKGEHATVRAQLFEPEAVDWSAPLEPRLIPLEQSNSTLVFGSSLLFKLQRVIDDGESVELEMSRHLAGSALPRPSPRVLGALTLQSRGHRFTLGLLSEYVENHSSAWELALGSLVGDFERLAAVPAPAELEAPAEFLEQIGLLAQRSAELHLALAAGSPDPAFAAERIEPSYQRALYDAAHALLARVCEELERRFDSLESSEQSQARAVLSARSELEARLARIVELEIHATRIRCHGDYHLGQVLFTGDDFVIIDFEGEPGRTLEERRRKHSPLRDVAGMLRSFDYAVSAALRRARLTSTARERLAGSADAMFGSLSRTFLRRYLETAGTASFIPPADSLRLLDFFELEKAVFEVGYELNTRPEWLSIPLASVLRLLTSGSPRELG